MQETISRIADRFDQTESTVHKIKRMCKTLKVMSKKCINWPLNQRTMTAICDGFENFRGVKGCIGAINGTHIPIKAPDDCGENYMNRKGFHSIVMQSVVDHQFKFLDCCIGWPGSFHDARIFNNSNILQNVLSNPMDMFPKNY